MTQNALRAGAAAVDITPEIGITLAGSLTRRYATSILDPLHARAIAIESGGTPEEGGTRLIFVLVDLIALIDQDTEPVRRAIGELAGVPAHHVTISCTHTHFAPGTAEGFETPREADYLQWARAQMIEAGRLAIERLQPAQVAWGIGQEGRPQYNRRFHMRGGGVRMNPSRGNPDILRAAGPTDPQVPVLLLQSTAGEPIAVLANYSLHYIGDFDGSSVSADYFGHFANIMRERKGENFVAMLTHGASGDINNINFLQIPEPWCPEKPEPTERGKIVARMVADQVDAVWENAQWHDSAVLDATEDIYQLGVRKISGDEIEQAKREAADTSLDLVERHYATERLALLDYPNTLPNVVQSVRVGDWAASTMTGEIFCQLGLDLKNASPFAVTAFIELANGYGGYVPTRYSYELGGYETWLARSAFATPGSGEEMVALAAAQLQRLSKGVDKENAVVPISPKREPHP